MPLLSQGMTGLHIAHSIRPRLSPEAAKPREAARFAASGSQRQAAKLPDSQRGPRSVKRRSREIRSADRFAASSAEAVRFAARTSQLEAAKRRDSQRRVRSLKRGSGQICSVGLAA